MVEVDKQKITMENKSLLGEDLSGSTVIIHIKDFEKFKSEFRMNDEAKIQKYWHSNNNERVLRCELIEKLNKSSFEMNIYDAVILDDENKIKFWSTATIDKEHQTSYDFSNKPVFRLFGLTDIDVEKFTELYEINIFKNYGEDSIERLKLALELFEDAKLYAAIKRRNKEKEALRIRLQTLEEWEKEINDLKVFEPKRYSEVTYWKEKDIKAEIHTIRRNLFGEGGELNLEKYWFTHIKHGVTSKKIEINKDAFISLSSHSIIAPDKLKSDVIVVRVKNEGDRFWIDLLKLKKSRRYYDKKTELDFDDHETIDSFVVTMGEKQFFFKP